MQCSHGVNQFGNCIPEFCLAIVVAGILIPFISPIVMQALLWKVFGRRFLIIFIAVACVAVGLLGLSLLFFLVFPNCWNNDVKSEEYFLAIAISTIFFAIAAYKIRLHKLINLAWRG